MRSFKSLALVIALCLLPFSALYSQNGSVSGKVVNNSKQPVEFATVALFENDSIFVSSSITDFDGNFSIKEIYPGDYKIQLDHIEYETYSSEPFTINPSEEKKLPVITMEELTNQLGEVVITKKKRQIEVQADKIVFNVAASPSASGVNGLDLLKLAPGVTIDLDNSITLLGKSNVQVYLNGVQSRLSGNDLVNFLQSLTSDTVENIEIISNPGARYEAEGTGGIINIRLKKSVATGFNGNATSSFTKGEEWRYSNNVSLNLGTGKVQTHLDVTQSHNNNLEFFDDSKIQNNILLLLDSREEQITDSYNIGFGIESQLDTNHYVGLDGRAIFNVIDNDLNSTTDIFIDQPREFLEILSSQVFRDGDASNFLFNGFHIWNMEDGSILSTNLSLGLYNSDNDTDQPNTYLDSDGTTIFRTEDTAFDTETQIDLWSAKLDYEKNWEKFGLQAGFKYARIKTENEFAFFNVENQVPIFDPTRSNDFNYTEQVTALYANFNINLAERWAVNAGMRMENTDSRGQLITEVQVDNKDVPRNYTDYFPSFGISYDDQEKHSVNLNIGRRITRPNYQDLNPFETPVSQLVVWKGNPFLNPNYIMNYQLSYSFKNELIVTTTYSETTGFFARIVEITGDDSGQIIPRNMEKAINYGVSISYPLNVIEDVWDVLLMVNASRESFEGDVESAVIDINNTNWNYRIQNNLKLPWGILMDVNFTQRSRWIWRGSVFIEGNEALGFGIRKNFLDDKLQLRITGADIFGTQRDYPYTSDYGGIDLDGVYTNDAQRFGAGLTYNFGGGKSERKQRDSALDDELNRIQN